MNFFPNLVNEKIYFYRWNDKIKEVNNEIRLPDAFRFSSTMYTDRKKYNYRNLNRFRSDLWDKYLLTTETHMYNKSATFYKYLPRRYYFSSGLVDPNGYRYPFHQYIEDMSRTIY